MRRLSIAILFFLSTLPSLNWAQDAERTQAVDEVLQRLGSVRGFNQVAISPDGTKVAWVQRARHNGGRGTEIMVAEARPGAKPHRVSAAGEEVAWEEQVAWSPDGKQLAFFSDAEKSGQAQLYVADAGGGTARRLTNLTGYLAAPGWSPDGKSIALLFIENMPRAAGPLQPMTPPTGVIEEHIYEQRLNIVDVAKGAVRAISPADMYVYEYDWAPDGSSFAAIAAHGDGDNNWWIAQLYRLTMDGQMVAIYKPKLQIANPQISPDAKQVAFIEGLMSDQGVTGGDIAVVPFAPAGGAMQNGQARNLTPNMPASATWLDWRTPDEVIFSELIDGNAGVATVTTGGKVTQLWSGSELISAGTWELSLSLNGDGKQSAVVRSSALNPPEIWVGPLGKWQQITNVNGGVKPLWGEKRNVHWRSDKFNVQGWLLLPRDYQPSRRYPLVVDVHGGPASACGAGWPSAMEAPFAAVGYFVLCPNPRGSYGQGEAFTQANVKDFGGGDLRDIMAGVDQVLREYPVDPNRLGIKGWSYGGYMTMWAETQTNRFAAAIAGAGLSDWLSYYGENDIDQWMIPYFGASVYDDPGVYARSQPINFVRNVKTPTLILVGDRDGECPAPQSFEWWHALKTFNVPVQFVVYANEGHMIQQPQHRRDIVVRSIGWFDKYLIRK